MQRSTSKTPQRRGAGKHVQRTRVADGAGRENSTARGKAQKIGEKKEANPRVERVRVQKKGATERRAKRSARNEEALPGE